MNLELNRAEKDIVKKVVNDKEELKVSIGPQSISILIGFILLLSPIVYLIINFDNADRIFKTVGIYLGIMILLGIIFINLSTFFIGKNRINKEMSLMKSVIRKFNNTNSIDLA